MPAGDVFGLDGFFLNKSNPITVSAVDINSTAAGAGITATAGSFSSGTVTLTLSTAAGLSTTPFYIGAKIAVSGLTSTTGVAFTGYNGNFVVTGFAGTTTVSYATTGYVGGVTAGITTTGLVMLVTDTAVTNTTWSSNQTHGWFGGGTMNPGYLSTVDRIDFSNDTGTASPRGSLSLARFDLAATGNSNYGWFGGGRNPATISLVDRIDFSNDSSTASVRGPLTSAKYSVAATGNSDYGWFGGGFTIGPITAISIVDRIDFSNDSGTSLPRGLLSLSRGAAATGNSNYGWFGGGTTFPGPIVSTVDRIDFSNDATTASPRGPLSLERSSLAATGNSNYGWFGGGFSPSTPTPIYYSTIDRIDFSNDSRTANIRGPLSAARQDLAATGNSNYGWFGGALFPSSSSRVDRIDFSNDSVSASVRGPLSSGKGELAATSGQARSRSITIPKTGTYGWFGGGFVNISYVDRIDFTNDTNVSPRGNLPSGRGYVAAAGNINYGWFAGASNELSIISRIDYSNDAINASNRAPFAAFPAGRGIDESSGAGNQNYGWFDGGGASPSMDYYQRINYANDLNAPSTRGSTGGFGSGTSGRGAVSNNNYGWWGCGFLNGRSYIKLNFSNDLATVSFPGAVTVTPQGPASYKYRPGTSCNRDYGWWAGGKNNTPSPSNFSFVERLNFSNDVANSVIRTYITARSELAGAGNYDYGWFTGGDSLPGPNTSLVERLSYANDSGSVSTRTPLISGTSRGGHAGVSNKP
jgi:hypothetical protein